MRTSRRLRQRVMYLTEFLEALFDREEVDAFLAVEGTSAGWPHTNALRDYALAEWQGDTAIGRALKARACDTLLNSPDGPPSAYAPGDFSADHEALARCHSALNKHKGQFDGLDRDQLLGSLSMTVQERCDSVARLCDPATVAAERERLQAVLTKERRQLERDGLSNAEITLLYDLRSSNQLLLPNLSVDDVEAVAKIYPKWRPGLYRLAWKLLGAQQIKVQSAIEAQHWLTFGRANLPETTSSDWAAITDTLRRSGFYEVASKAVEEALRRSDSFRAWFEKGILLCHHHKRYEEAEAAFRKAVGLDPSYAGAWAALGCLLADHLGQHEEAEAALRKAVELDPTRSWLNVKLDEVRHRRLIAPVAAAVAAENWGIVREHLEQWIADPQTGPEMWVSDALIDDVVGGAVRLGRGETLLRLLREIGLERLALPLTLALEAALAGSAEGLADVEPEARTAAENLYARLTDPPSKQ
jgi:tetratricopeptide (TPR) repeat protein